MPPEEARDGETRTVNESVVAAMDGTETDLFAYLPYIFQDLWEIGSSPEDFIQLIREHANMPLKVNVDNKGDYSALRVLDLGCGKGAVSVNIARELGCSCVGVDGVGEFVEQARAKATEYGVGHLCEFHHGDARTFSEDPRNHGGPYDVVVLGAVGPICGDYSRTFAEAAEQTAPEGVLLVEDGYIADESDFKHPPLEKRSQFLAHAMRAGLDLVDELILDPEELKEFDEKEFRTVERRCSELMEKYPDRKSLFENYVFQQKSEYEIMETELVCATMVFRRRKAGNATEQLPIKILRTTRS